MVSQVSIINAKKYKVPLDLIYKSVELFFEYLIQSSIIDGKIQYEFTIVLTSTKQIEKYNYKFRNKKVPTDVLSFCSENRERLSDREHTHRGEKCDLGDLLICSEVIQENSMRFDVGFEEEILRVIVHGILHLIGFDHKGTLGESKEKIFIIQEDFLKSLKEKGFIK